MQKTAEATGDLIGNKIIGRITKFSKSSLQNNWETIANENGKDIPKKRCNFQKKGRKALMI